MTSQSHPGGSKQGALEDLLPNKTIGLMAPSPSIGPSAPVLPHDYLMCNWNCKKQSLQLYLSTATCQSLGCETLYISKFSHTYGECIALPYTGVTPQTGTKDNAPRSLIVITPLAKGTHMDGR